MHAFSQPKLLNDLQSLARAARSAFCSAFSVSETSYCGRALLGLSSLLLPWTPNQRRELPRSFWEAQKEEPRRETEERRKHFPPSWRLNAFPLVQEWHDPLCSGVRYLQPSFKSCGLIIAISKILWDGFSARVTCHVWLQWKGDDLRWPSAEFYLRLPSACF